MIGAPMEGTFEITEYDQLIRELDIIDNLFKSQFKDVDTVNAFPYPDIRGEGGQRSFGFYVDMHDIWSNVKMFHLSFYKKYFTERFEKSNNNILLKKQLSDIVGKATVIRDYYNTNLIKKELYENYFEERGIHKTLEKEAYKNLVNIQMNKFHEAKVYVEYYYINLICYGSLTGIDLDNYKFRFHLTNFELATFCQEIIDFFCQLDIDISPNIESIFNPNYNGFEVCKGILEDIGITKNGECVLKKLSGKLIGVIHAISITPKMLTTDYTKDLLLKIFNAYLKTDFKTSKEKRSKGFEEGFDDAMRYIKINFK